VQEFWEILGAFVSGVAAIVGAGFAIKRVIKHEREWCDTRIDAFKEGLDRKK
jgi:hypothetical protein